MSQSQDNEDSKVATKKSSKPYKIVLESVTQEKKKLQYMISYNDEAPPGYTFVPVGIPELTDYCKELSREKEVDVYVVSTAPQSMSHLNPKHISHHIHRIGHHFRNQIVEQACDIQGFRHRGHAYVRSAAESFMQPKHLAKKLDSHGQKLGLAGQNPNSNQSSQQVRATIKELFPKIPTADLDAIVTRAFEEGTNRVGNAESIPLPRRVQLAVVAHIRHRYTDYDILLHAFSWHQARQMVEQPCLDQIVKWRGEDEADVVELEDIFREVIIIDDDEEEEEEEARDKGDGSGKDNREQTKSSEGISRSAQALERESSVEIISTRVRHDAVLGRETPQDEANPEYIRSKARTIGPIAKRSIPEIVHVQPQRDMRKAPVLTWQEQLQRRYNEARARQKRGGDLNEPIQISSDDQNHASLGASNSLHPEPLDQSIPIKPNAPNIGLKSFAQRVSEQSANSKQLPPHLRPMYVPLSHQATEYNGQSGKVPHDLHRPIYVPAQPDQYRLVPKSNRMMEGRSSEYLRSDLDHRYNHYPNENLRSSGYDSYNRSHYVGKRKSHAEINDDRVVPAKYDVTPKRQRLDQLDGSLTERRSDAQFGTPGPRPRRSEAEYCGPVFDVRATEVIDLTNSPDSPKSRMDRQSLSSGNSPRYPLPPPPPPPQPPQQRLREEHMIARAAVMVDNNGRRFYPAREGEEVAASNRGIPQYDGVAHYPDQYYSSQGYGHVPPRHNGGVTHASYANGWTESERYDRRQVPTDPRYSSRSGIARHPAFEYEADEYEYIEPHFSEMRIGNSSAGSGSNWGPPRSALPPYSSAAGYNHSRGNSQPPSF